MGNGLSALLGDSPPPHLQRLPSSKSIEKLQCLDLRIQGLLLGPFSYIEKGMRLASHILTKTLLADSVVLESSLTLMLTDQLEFDQL